jgi:putative Ca2+/H+ antiporter (TMEM165/GDT1 family)
VLGELLRAFVTVFPAELPDKTMVATIILVTRYRHPLGVWLGAAAAFLVHVVVAVAAGSAIALLPERVVGGVVTVLFSTTTPRWRWPSGSRPPAWLRPPRRGPRSPGASG